MSVTSAPIILDERVIGVFVWWAVKSIAVGDLSGRQRQVLCLAAQGLRDGEIGERLKLSRSTVRQHLWAVHHRLKARNTTHAVVIALKLKILSLDEVSDAQDQVVEKFLAAVGGSAAERCAGGARAGRE